MKPVDNSESTLETIQTLTTYLLRDPVKEAVREALREEAKSVKIPPESPETSKSSTARKEQSTESTVRSSKLPLVLALVAVAAISYLIRRRRSSDDEVTLSRDSEPSPEMDRSTARMKTDDADQSMSAESDDKDSSVSPVSDQS